MSKYHSLWDYILLKNQESLTLTFFEIHTITGFELDHSFLSYKKELLQYGFCVSKISMKEKKVIFNKLKDTD